MMLNLFSLRFHLLTLALFLMVLPARGQKKSSEHRVYEYVVESVSGSFDDIEGAVVRAALAEGWKTLAVTNVGAPNECSYGARVRVLYHPDYARQLMEINPQTAPFAIVDRINLFEDEKGIHLSIVNPHSINRTVLMDDTAFTDLTESHRLVIRSMITGAVEGTESNLAYGQKRKKGHIGKTMFVMAGGKFSDKIQEKLVIPGGDVADVAARVREGLSQDGPEWGLRMIFELPLPSYDVVLFGSTGTRMESKSAAIVKAGSNKVRKDYACPGLAHAAAYPLEIVVTKKGENVEVQIVDAMFRMKMYYEDAGKMAFMKNMGMPGSLADELTDQIRLMFGDYPQ